MAGALDRFAGGAGNPVLRRVTDEDLVRPPLPPGLLQMPIARLARPAAGD